MNKDLDRKLCEKYPDIFNGRNKPMSETAMCWGFQHGDGWYDIVDKLCGQLMFIKKLTGVGVVANTVKEKFGTIRFYVWGDTESKPTVPQEDGGHVQDLIDNAIHYADDRSGCTCEECGEWGKTRVWANWYYTRCYKHWKELMKEQYGWDIPEDEGEYEEWEEKTMKELEEKLKAAEAERLAKESEAKMEEKQ